MGKGLKAQARGVAKLTESATIAVNSKRFEKLKIGIGIGIGIGFLIIAVVIVVAVAGMGREEEEMQAMIDSVSDHDLLVKVVIPDAPGTIEFMMVWFLWWF